MMLTVVPLNKKRACVFIRHSAPAARVRAARHERWEYNAWRFAGQYDPRI